MEMAIFAYKTRIQIKTFWDFSNMSGWGKMRSTYNVESTTTYIIIYIYPQIHLYMGKVY